MQPDRIIERLDGMVSAGRITAEEASRLRAAAGTEEFEVVLAGIRARHAQAHTDAAVADGSMSSEDAEASLARVRAGDHSGELRRHIRGVE
jgi:polyhydroxyalkanoate synthesis regulator phasin